MAVRLSALRQALAAAQRERAGLEDALRQSQKMEALGRLTVGIAHDFNNHLTVISSNVELVKRRLDAGNERLTRHADAAMQGVQRAALLTSRLLSFSRQPEAEPEPVDVGALLRQLSDLLGRTLGERVSLDVRLPEEPWFIWADVTQMENALLSLAVNAREQVPDGGCLTIAVSNVHLDEVFAAAHPAVLPGPFIQVAISESGAGPATFKADLDPGHSGLTMARGFVRAAGGCLLRSDPASPSLSLRLFLPRFQPPVLTAAAGWRRHNGRTTILVVEDDEAVREACVEALRDNNYEILAAPDAMEAFRLIADRGGIDLLFTDLGLPGGVSGRTLADAARNVDPAMRVLFTTGYGRTDVPDRSDALVLRKPFTPAQLAEKVREALGAGRPAARPETIQG
jgi:CheY-like chemotaxis protein